MSIHTTGMTLLTSADLSEACSWQVFHAVHMAAHWVLHTSESCSESSSSALYLLASLHPAALVSVRQRAACLRTCDADGPLLLSAFAVHQATQGAS